MPNWCYTTFLFKGEESELNILHDKIVEWTSREYRETGFGSDWLGNILYGAGLKDRVDNQNPSKQLRCRGTLNDIDDVDCGVLFLSTETAWVPMAKMWNAIINQLGLKTVGFTFEAEEPGCDIYWIYDPNGYNYFKDEVYIDAWGTDELENISGYYSEEQAVDVLNEFFGTQYRNISNFSSLCEAYNEEHEQDDCSIYVHLFERDNVLQD